METDNALQLCEPYVDVRSTEGDERDSVGPSLKNERNLQLFTPTPLQQSEISELYLSFAFATNDERMRDVLAEISKHDILRFKDLFGRSKKDVFANTSVSKKDQDDFCSEMERFDIDLQ